MIESSEHLEDVQNVVALYESLQEYYGAEKVGLLHGKLTSDEKDEVMQDSVIKTLIYLFQLL